MGLLILVIGIFSGLFVAIATMYSIAQAMLTGGALRWAHLALIVATCAVMAVLYQRNVVLGQILAIPLVGVAVWTVSIEERWFKAFPLLHLAFGVVVVAGVVAF